AGGRRCGPEGPRPRCRCPSSVALGVLATAGIAAAGAGPARPDPPPDLDDEVLARAPPLRAKQLFIDPAPIEDLRGAQQVLQRPVKHPRNPVLVRDQPWEGLISYGSILLDAEERLYKLWYQIYQDDVKKPRALLAYATSPDGLTWHKPVVNR